MAGIVMVTIRACYLRHVLTCRERARHVPERRPERSHDVDNCRLGTGEGLAQRGTDLLDTFDADAAAANGARNSGEVHVGERAGNRPVALAMLDPTERAIVEHDGDDGNLLVTRRHKPVDSH